MNPSAWLMVGVHANVATCAPIGVSQPRMDVNVHANVEKSTRSGLVGHGFGVGWEQKNSVRSVSLW